MIKKLKELIFGSPPIQMEHNFFGTILFEGNPAKSEDNDYWKAEMNLKTLKEPLTVLVTADKNGPTDKQVQLYEELTSDLDALFKKCWPIFEPDFKLWTKKDFSGNWKDDFKLESIEIPKDASLNNKWTVMYYVPASGHYFTARFINGVPMYNNVDG